MRTALRAALALGVTASTALGVAVAAPAAPAATRAATTWVAPHPERIISAPSYPGVAAWGVAFNPITGELLVGDYLSAQVRRYTAAGKYLGDFSNPTGNVGGVTSAIAVDPRNGYVYVDVTGEGRTSKSVRKYTPQGVFMYDFNVVGPATWITVDKQGNLWSPSAFQGQKLNEFTVSDATKTATLILQVSNPGSGPGQFANLTGLAVDASGNVYVADSVNRTVHSYSSAGAFRFDIGDGTIFPGDIRGVLVDDANSKLYVANSAKSTIEVFSLAGAHLATFGSAGTGPGQFSDGARQLALTPDGHLLAADYGNFRLLEFDTAGHYVSMLPSPALPMDPAGLANARGLTVDPTTGDILVADGWGQRIERFSADGTLLASKGRRGSRLPDGMNYPKSVAVDPTNGNVWVGNYEGAPNLVVYTPDFSTVVRRILTPKFLNDLEIVGNSVYAVIRKAGTVNVYDRSTGALTRTVGGTSLGLIRGVGVDPVTGNLWITSDSTTKLYVLSPTGTLLQTLAVDGRGWGVAFSGNTVYVADAQANKVIAYDRVSYARLGSFGSKGFGFGQLDGVSGVTLDAAGHIWVVEERSGRVQEFGTDPVPAPETTAPTVAYSATQPTGPQVVATGTASDASGVAMVEVQVKNLTTGTYYNARTNTWTSTALWSPAVRWGPLTASSWRFTTALSYPATSYQVRTRATDVLGNVSKGVVRTFSTP